MLSFFIKRPACRLMKVAPLKESICQFSTPSGLIEASDPQTKELIQKYMLIKPDFLTDSEEASILGEVEPYMKKLRYEFDHWDNAIHGYRETERKDWSEANKLILNKVKKFAFDNFNSENKNKTSVLSHVHVLDLHEDGYIKLHVDSTRFCGNTIAGLSLLSDCVMRLENEKEKGKWAKILLKRRSLYIMRCVLRIYDKNRLFLCKLKNNFKLILLKNPGRMLDMSLLMRF